MEGAWLDRFIESFDSIEDRLAAGKVSPLSLTCCTGEEMAPHLVIDHSESDFQSGIDASGGELERLPWSWVSWSSGIRRCWRSGRSLTFADRHTDIEGTTRTT